MGELFQVLGLFLWMFALPAVHSAIRFMRSGKVTVSWFWFVNAFFTPFGLWVTVLVLHYKTTNTNTRSVISTE